MREFSTGAVRDDTPNKGRYDLLPWGAIHALAQHCQRGAEHYGERNVDKGIPQCSLIDSGIRHLSMYIQGDREPHHLIAAAWNIMWAVEQELKRPEMIVGLPERERQKSCETTSNTPSACYTQTQLFAAVEAMAALQDGLCKFSRGAQSADGIASGIADVFIALEDVIARYGFEPEVTRHRKLRPERCKDD